MQGVGLLELECVVRSQMAGLALNDRLRRLPEFEECKIDFATNDYLGLQADSNFQSELRDQIGSLPLGSAASRLLGAQEGLYSVLENEFAEFKGTESALFFPSGYAANEALIRALSQHDTTFFYDEYVHASMIDGIHQSPLPKPRKLRFSHNNMRELGELLCRCNTKIKIILVEAIYSMDGDLAKLEALLAMASEFGAILVVDEAHAVGILGARGEGLVGASSPSVITINPCGKAFAAQGAFYAGPSWLRDYLIATARPFIYTTAPSPWLAAALRHTLRVVPTLSDRRQAVMALSRLLRQKLEIDDDESHDSVSPIIPIILGSDAAAKEASQFLARCGIRCPAIRPPTVPIGTARLRLSLHYGLTVADIEDTVHALTEFAASVR